MKNYLLLSIILITFNTPLFPAAGCLERSTHADPCMGPDYKKLYPVWCACPCNRYSWDPKGAKCFNCWHYHNPAQVKDLTWDDYRGDNRTYCIR